MPVVAVQSAFTALCNEPLVANNAAIQQFVAYFGPTWLDGQFLVHMWNVFNNSSARNNNQVELALPTGQDCWADTPERFTTP